jgi:hypothetical protein
MTLMMRVGFVAATAALLCLFELSRLPLTFDANAWYFGYSVMTIIFIVSIAVACSIVASGSAVAPTELRRDASMAAVS